eukprot:90861-Prorocentrum_minimum.AAC.1
MQHAHQLRRGVWLLTLGDPLQPSPGGPEQRTNEGRAARVGEGELEHRGAGVVPFRDHTAVELDGGHVQ